MTPAQGADYTRQHNMLINEAALAITYWRQRMRDNIIQIGDLPSKLLFRRLRHKQQQTKLHMLRNDDGSWLTTQKEIEELVHQHFKSLLTSFTATTATSTNSIDLVLRELNLLVITAHESSMLLRSLLRMRSRNPFFHWLTTNRQDLMGIMRGCSSTIGRQLCLVSQQRFKGNLQPVICLRNEIL